MTGGSPQSTKDPRASSRAGWPPMPLSFFESLSATGSRVGMAMGRGGGYKRPRSCICRFRSSPLTTPSHNSIHSQGLELHTSSTSRSPFVPPPPVSLHPRTSRSHQDFCPPTSTRHPPARFHLPSSIYLPPTPSARPRPPCGLSSLLSNHHPEPHTSSRRESRPTCRHSCSCRHSTSRP